MDNTDLLMCELDIGNHEIFEDHLDLLGLRQQQQYKYAFSPYKKMGNNILRYQDRYYENARFIIYAEPPYATKFSRCGTSALERKARCKKRLFCTCCAYSHGAQALRRVNGTAGGRFNYFVTLGYKGDLEWAARDQSEIYWQACKHAAGRVLNRRADGAMVSLEMHLRQFRPIILNPHAHVVLSFDLEQDEEHLVQQLQDEMADYLIKELGEECRLIPNVRVSRIEDGAELATKVHYLFKPIDLKDPYDSACILHGRTPERMVELNSEMRDFIGWMTELVKMKKLCQYKGVWNRSSNNCIARTRREIRQVQQRRNRSTSNRRANRALNPSPARPTSPDASSAPRPAEVGFAE